MMVEYIQRPRDFTRDILAWFENYKDAREHEIQLLIEVNAAANTCWYNRSLGTGVMTTGHTEETKRKISESKKGKQTRRNLEVTAETRDKIRKTLTGVKHTEQRKMNMRKPKNDASKIIQILREHPPMLGKKHTEATKEKMRNAHRNRNKILPLD